MLLLSAADVHDRGLADALDRLADRPDLRAVFEAERAEARLDRRTLYFDAASGWRVIDLCDVCGADVGVLDDAPVLAALCEDCDAEQTALDRADAAGELAALDADDDGLDGLDGLGVEDPATSTLPRTG
ncbi:hypothetical protein [Aquipuribacter nitratireducens]|uniref:DksA C4-type domain-containing protein n=1 Tax=Aquipuribacter nitratireducens TaxID=650104 RepID=A0ABW0GSD2_9MICO